MIPKANKSSSANQTIITLLVIIMLTITGIFILGRNIFRLDNTSVTNGKIISFAEDTNGRSTRRAVITFNTKTDSRIEFVNEIGSRGISFSKVGDPVQVRYKNNNPQDAHVKSFFEEFGFPALFIFGPLYMLFTIRKDITSLFQTTKKK